MIRALLGWARAHKEGKLRVLFWLYRWFRFSVVPLIYERGISLRPDWIPGYYALGNLLALKHSSMLSTRGHDVRKANKVGQRALECFQKVITLDPEYLEGYQDYSSMLLSMGKVAEALHVAERAFDMQGSLAERHQLDRLGIRFISSVGTTNSIGAMIHVDAYVKAEAFGLRPPGKPILLVRPGQSIHNPHFLNYWRQYITVISDPTTVECLLPLVRYLEDAVHWGVMCGKQFLYHPSAAALIYKLWEDERRPPLLTLSRDDYERGWDRLNQMGVPKGAWFVCLHVREAGFKDGISSQSAYRNADIETYLLAMKNIVARGGWVIRMGNPTMKPLPIMEHVIDYAHSELRSDWMEVFLCAQCRFLINTSSGVGAVTASFGVPLVLTNYMPTCALLYSSRDLFIPKLCRSVDQQRYLTFEELMSSPVSTSVLQHQYDYMNLKVVDNSPEEINDLVTEMLDRLDGTLVYSAEDERLQERFKTLTALKGTLHSLDNFPVNCRIGRDFLRKHVSLLPSVDENERRPAPRAPKPATLSDSFPRNGDVTNE